MKWTSWLLCTILLFFWACREESEFGIPLVFTGEVTEIDSTGAVFHAQITNLGSEPVLEFGFVWDAKPDPVLAGAEKFVIRKQPVMGIYSQRINTTLKEGVIYHVRSFVRTLQTVTYGKDVFFESLGSRSPVVDAVSPNPANLGDTLMILGNHFSYRAKENAVSFNEHKATVLNVTQDTLWVVVPVALDTVVSSVTVSILGNTAVAADLFRLVEPVIHDFTPKTGTFGTWVTLNGENFLSNPATFHVWVEAWESEVTELQSGQAVFRIPDSLDLREARLTVGMNNLIVTSEESFRLESFHLADFIPIIAVTGDTIRITGSNFSPVPVNNEVVFGGLNAQVAHSSLNEIMAIVPMQESGFYPGRDINITVEVIEGQLEFGETLHVNDAWFRLHDSPVYGSVQPYKRAFCRELDGKAYILSEDASSFFSFDPESDHWVELAPFPGIHRKYGTGFVLGNAVYFGTGWGETCLMDWWKYDVADNSWAQKGSFDGGSRLAAVGFTAADWGYVGTGKFWSYLNYTVFDDIWKYHPVTDNWTHMIDYPPDTLFSIWRGMFLGIASLPISTTGSSGMIHSPIHGSIMRNSFLSPISDSPLDFFLKEIFT
jgi:hypothetical protein